MTGQIPVFRNLLVALCLGAGLGVVYGFLRPARRSHPHLADLIFVCCAFYAWLWHGFAVCRGDLRLGYTLALLAGGVV